MTDYISEKGLFEYSDKLGVALSGGADSVALISCLKKAGYDITALHVEHGIRGEESISDMRFVEELCRSLDVPLYIHRAHVPKERLKGESLEAAARRIRYSFFEKMTRELQLKYIAVAHHSEDVSETFMLNLLRGSGLAGLSSMRAKREPNIVRPLLFALRSEIEVYLKEEGLKYVTDSTNMDTDYTRNYIRRELMPGMRELNPSLHRTLLRTSELIAEEDAALSEIADIEYRKLAIEHDNSIDIDREKLLRLNKAVARRVIRIACQKLHGLKDIEQSHIEAIYGLAKEGGTGRRFELKGRFFAEVSYNHLKIRTKDYIINNCDDILLALGETAVPGGRIITEAAVSFQKMFPESMTQYVVGGALFGAVIRRRRSGDMFSPFGGGRKKLKDWLIDKKIPRDERDNLLLIARDEEVLWVIGRAISNKLAIDKDTHDLIRIEFIAEEK